MSSDGKEDGEKEDASESCGATGGQVTEDDEDSGQASLTLLQSLLSRLGLTIKSEREEEKEKHLQVLEEVTFDGIAKYILSDKCQNIVVMAGAGISTSAGIPDFRSPGTGLYDNLQQYNLPYPEAVFDISFFHSNPEPFFKLAKELYPGKFKPTMSHYFIRLLNEKGLLLRHYTQNIDTLERIAGVPGEKIVEAHGTFHSSHCLTCGELYSQEWIKDEIFADKIPTCEQDSCNGVVKPDIVFFGENLPQRFSTLLSKDMPKCDVLIIMGTSLAVQPFASLVDHVPPTTPRLLVNREKCGQGGSFFPFGLGTGLRFDDPENYRDVVWLGSCDDGCLALADLLGWKDELTELVAQEHKKIDGKHAELNQQLVEMNARGVQDSSKSTEKNNDLESTNDNCSSSQENKCGDKTSDQSEQINNMEETNQAELMVEKDDSQEECTKPV